MEIIVDKIYENRSVESFLKQHMSYSRGLLRKIKRSGAVIVNGTPVLMAHKLRAGDVITIEISEKGSDIQPQFIPLEILFEDKEVMVVNKPSGMLVHPLTGEPGGTLANAVIYHWLNKNREALVFRPVYRIDRDTSGLVLISKNRLSYNKLLRQLTERTMLRTYIAVVEGYMPASEGIINFPIARKTGSIVQREVSWQGKSAVTRYKVVRTLPSIGASLLAVRLETGRTHQIRVHLSHMGHPLLGDTLYGGRSDYICRHALHVQRIKFLHPVTGDTVDLYCPAPSDIGKLMGSADEIPDF
ncbi:RluA family pseudouridine synthase [Desulfocucumis palustris]|nr:RluA family pseudouridine synthase [Desulfocucumis palustris]